MDRLDVLLNIGMTTDICLGAVNFPILAILWQLIFFASVIYRQ